MIEKIKLTIIDWKQNNENLYLPYLITKELGEIQIISHLIVKQIGYDNHKWIGQQIEVNKKVGRKYITYFIEPKDYGYFREKTYIFKTEECRKAGEQDE